MYIIRRWWERHALQILLVSLALIAAWAIRQTQGAAIFEMYQVITLPFQSEPTQAERLGNARMLELQARVVELESQNQKLKELLDYAPPAEKRRGIAAPVVGRSADHWWQQVTLGRGSQVGIQVGFIVTAPGGLVGRVIGVTPNTSRVLLISDPSSQIGVTISRSRYVGFLQGQSASYAVMQFFDKVPDVRRGDVVSTSPYSQIFPSGLPVGRVESVNMNKSPAPEAVIALSAPIPYLEWVVVYPHN
jgi:rod shape-determining protein MreC